MPSDQARARRSLAFYDVLIGVPRHPSSNRDTHGTFWSWTTGQHLLWLYVTPATWNTWNTWLLILANILYLLHWHALACHWHVLLVDPSTIHQSSVRPSVHPSIHLSILRPIYESKSNGLLHLLFILSLPFLFLSFSSDRFASPWCVPFHPSILPSGHQWTSKCQAAYLPTYPPTHLRTYQACPLCTCTPLLTIYIIKCVYIYILYMNIS